MSSGLKVAANLKTLHSVQRVNKEFSLPARRKYF